MAQTTFRMAKGDTIAMPDGVAGSLIWRIERRLREGYLTSSSCGQPDRIWTHDEIMEAWCDRRMQHWPCDVSGLDAALAEMLQSDIDRWPIEKIFEARCREAYVERVDKLLAEGVGKYKAYSRAAKEITAERTPEWEKRRSDLAAVAASQAPRGRKVKSAMRDDAPISAFALGESAVRKWWTQWNRAGRDLRALIARDHLRGDHKPRFDDRRGEQRDDADIRCVYGAMEWIGRTVYMGQAEETGKGRRGHSPTSTKSYAFGRLGLKLRELGLPEVSMTTFAKFIRHRFDAFDEYRARFGPRMAYLKFHIFERRALPERAMEEVEVDHCLLDVFAMDRHGRVARPWLTVLICRATKMIVGIHIGFDPPSSETLARAVLHAILPKVLDGIGAKNDWPCMGGFDMLITDRGLELMSEAFQRAGNRLKFAIVNLPGRSPWLKATVERFFGTLGVRVLSHLEGATRAKAADWYDPQARAKYGLGELTAMIVRWIVDEYHEDDHATLGTSPRKRWRELAQDALDGGVRVPPPFKDVYRDLGESGIERVISNVGIAFENNHYSSAELVAFRRTWGGSKPVEVIAEYFDRSFIWAKLDKQWIMIPATNSTMLKGRSRYANRVINRLARKMTPKGEDVTEDILERARIQCEEEARTLQGRRAMRFLSEGALATDVAGNDGLLSVLANGLHAPENRPDTAATPTPNEAAEDAAATSNATPGTGTPAEPADVTCSGGAAITITRFPQTEAKSASDDETPQLQDIGAILAGISAGHRIIR